MRFSDTSSAKDNEKTHGRGKNAWESSTPRNLWEQLYDWRKTLPQPLRWSDSDLPSMDVNHARLRGKYYGCAYIITRYTLFDAIRNPNLHCAPGEVNSMIEKVRQERPVDTPQQLFDEGPEM